eukprot:TRINITY_DN6003_c0_g1_i1.p1 TRINITY_DN6003_c0_g1~~TRINITY_DN6003_c0_g1_i1.p1  ORF type:complete len:430 (+),score=52.40 TRINITY_DN6003_c0_g1_i1:26-1291(+)
MGQAATCCTSARDEALRAGRRAADAAKSVVGGGREARTMSAKQKVALLRRTSAEGASDGDISVSASSALSHEELEAENELLRLKLEGLSLERDALMGKMQNSKEAKSSTPKRVRVFLGTTDDGEHRQPAREGVSVLRRQETLDQKDMIIADLQRQLHELNTKMSDSAASSTDDRGSKGMNKDSSRRTAKIKNPKDAGEVEQSQRETRNGSSVSHKHDSEERSNRARRSDDRSRRSDDRHARDEGRRRRRDENDEGRRRRRDADETVRASRDREDDAKEERRKDRLQSKVETTSTDVSSSSPKHSSGRGDLFSQGSPLPTETVHHSTSAAVQSKQNPKAGEKERPAHLADGSQLSLLAQGSVDSVEVTNRQKLKEKTSDNQNARKDQLQDSGVSGDRRGPPRTTSKEATRKTKTNAESELDF